MEKALTQIRFEQWLQNGRPSLIRLGGNDWLKFRETADGFEYMYRMGCWRPFKPRLGGMTAKQAAKDTHTERRVEDYEGRIQAAAGGQAH